LFRQHYLVSDDDKHKRSNAMHARKRNLQWNLIKFNESLIVAHFSSKLNLTDRDGRSIAQAVSRWLPTVAAWVQTWVWSCGIL
jgi:hypothetical protein